jgi:hypothetical protein
MRTDVSVATRGGGLSSISVGAWTTASLNKFGGASCGGGGRMGSSTASLALNSVERIVVSGWLDLTVTGIASYQVSVRPPGAAADSVPVPRRDVAGGMSKARVFLPAGGAVIVEFWSGTSAALYDPPDARRASSATGILRGVVTPVGAAVGGERGARLARRAIALPAAVSCSTGRAGVRLTKVAKRKAKSVVLSVNGHVAKRVKRVTRARGYAVRVPRSGPITITANVTPKHGKKVKVRRSYAACR